jgi:menaquinone-dependent protoporphyrinogen oxidase
MSYVTKQARALLPSSRRQGKPATLAALHLCLGIVLSRLEGLEWWTLFDFRLKRAEITEERIHPLLAEVKKMTILVAYASKYGSTQGIAERIAEQLRQLGKAAEARSMDDVADPDSYEAFVLGSAIYAGSWLKEAREWVRRHQAVLAQHPVWFFSSGPLGTEVKDINSFRPKEMTEFQQTIRPREERIFFGAFDYHKMSFPDRMILKATSATGQPSRPGQQASPKTWDEGLGQRVVAKLTNPSTTDHQSVHLGYAYPDAERELNRWLPW